MRLIIVTLCAYDERRKKKTSAGICVMPKVGSVKYMVIERYIFGRKEIQTGSILMLKFYTQITIYFTEVGPYGTKFS